ncbi:MAG: Omp28-related outer membrane protein [Bacteroidales bacterium]|jgi:hypothetical protein|nr:Omp28-related outer membrane protein [Bacteroidales bacterium]
MIKKILILESLLVFVAILLLTCDKIEKPYSTQTVEITYCDTPTFPPLNANDVIQKYLLEDFTGHKCPNCPRGQRTAAQMKVAMGDTLIVVSIHTGSLSRPDASGGDCAFTTDFRTDMGTAIDNAFGASDAGLPKGMINRLTFGTKPLVDDLNWEASMRSIERKAPSIGLQIIPDIHNDTVCIFVKTSLLSTIDSGARICVALVEDSIVAPQKGNVANGDLATMCDYVHNHVLRCGATSYEGVALGISQAGDTTINAFAIALNTTQWNTAHCHLIAYIIDKTTQQILQIEEKKLIE